MPDFGVTDLHEAGVSCPALHGLSKAPQPRLIGPIGLVVRPSGSVVYLLSSASQGTTITTRVQSLLSTYLERFLDVLAPGGVIALSFDARLGDALEWALDGRAVVDEETVIGLAAFESLHGEAAARVEHGYRRLRHRCRPSTRPPGRARPDNVEQREQIVVTAPIQRHAPPRPHGRGLRSRLCSEVVETT